MAVQFVWSGSCVTRKSKRRETACTLVQEKKRAPGKHRLNKLARFSETSILCSLDPRSNSETAYLLYQFFRDTHHADKLSLVTLVVLPRASDERAAVCHFDFRGFLRFFPSCHPLFFLWKTVPANSPMLPVARVNFQRVKPSGTRAPILSPPLLSSSPQLDRYLSAPDFIPPGSCCASRFTGRMSPLSPSPLPPSSIPVIPPYPLPPIIRTAGTALLQ